MLTPKPIHHVLHCLYGAFISLPMSAPPQPMTAPPSNGKRGTEKRNKVFRWKLPHRPDLDGEQEGRRKGGGWA